MVREAQRTAALLRKHLTVVPALDLTLDDTIHFGTAGNLVLADRLARCALGAAYGRSVEHRAPDILEAAMRGDQVLELRFGPVTGRLDTYRPVSNPFRVEDENGVAPGERTVFYHRDTVRLYLSRPCRGKVRVSCGYGEDPDVLPVGDVAVPEGIDLGSRYRAQPGPRDIPFVKRTVRHGLASSFDLYRPCVCRTGDASL